MKKLVVNRQYGGFGLSHEGRLKYAELAGFQIFGYDVHPGKNFDYIYTPYTEGARKSLFVLYFKKPIPEKYTKEEFNDFYKENGFNDSDIERDDQILIKTIEELGTEKASGRFAKLEIVEIPDDVEWTIEENDGAEWVSEVHRTW